MSIKKPFLVAASLVIATQSIGLMSQIGFSNKQKESLELQGWTEFVDLPPSDQDEAIRKQERSFQKKQYMDAFEKRHSHQLSLAQTSNTADTITKTQTTTKFFYVDDFFYWLGCKFVTCDKSAEKKKDNQQEESKPNNEKENQEKQQAQQSPKPVEEKKMPVHKRVNKQKMNMKDDVVVIKDDQPDSEEDAKEMEEAEKSMQAKSVQELSKISKEYDAKKDKRQHAQKNNDTKNQTSGWNGPGSNPGHDAPLPFPNNKPDKNGNFAKKNHTAVAKHNKTSQKAIMVQKNETHHKNKSVHQNISKAGYHGAVVQLPQNMSQKNRSVKSNNSKSLNCRLEANVTKSKNETEKNSSKALIVNQTLPQKNVSQAVVVPSVQDPNKFSKQNPFADFSGFEKTVDQMEPLAADVQSEQLANQIQQTMQQQQQQIVSPQEQPGAIQQQPQAPVAQQFQPLQYYEPNFGQPLQIPQQYQSSVGYPQQQPTFNLENISPRLNMHTADYQSLIQQQQQPQFQQQLMQQMPQQQFQFGQIPM